MWVIQRPKLAFNQPIKSYIVNEMMSSLAYICANVAYNPIHSLNNYIFKCLVLNLTYNLLVTVPT